jgi:Inward rectifier potassium channel C-terminal domain
MQCLVGIFLDALVLGVIYARFERPQFRQHTVRFSDKACISTRNGVPYLMIRVGNLRKSQLIETHVTLVLVHMLETEEGERTLHLERLKLGHSEKVYLVMPAILLHPLDEQSPLHNMSMDELERLDPEIIAVLEGIEASTSDTIQAVYSYKFCDMEFGYRFAQLAHVISMHSVGGVLGRLRTTWQRFRGLQGSEVPQTVWDLNFNRFDEVQSGVLSC